MYLVDAVTKDCVIEMPEAFRRDAVRELSTHFQQEMTSSMIELVSGVHSSPSSLLDELRSQRAEVARIAGLHGMQILAAGSHPFTDWSQQTVTSKPRYELLVSEVRLPSVRTHVCGLHIHVGVPSGIARIALMSRLRRHLPLFLALSASSPFWRGYATGVNSYRTLANNELPRSALPPAFTDEAEYRRYLGALTASRLIPDESFIWWALRPARLYPTIELRICDSCPRVEDALALACLFRALVHATCARGVSAAAFDACEDSIVEENRWQAARYGLEAHLLTLDGSETRTVESALLELMAAVADSIDITGGASAVEKLRAIAAEGTSADRQTRIYRDALSENLTESAAVSRVAEHLVSETEDVSPTPGASRTAQIMNPAQP